MFGVDPPLQLEPIRAKDRGGESPGAVGHDRRRYVGESGEAPRDATVAPFSVAVMPVIVEPLKLSLNRKS